MATGLAANIEIFADGQSIFEHNADFEECAPNAAAEDIVTKLYDDEIMAKIDNLQEQGAEVVYKVSIATSDGGIIVDGVGIDLVPDESADFAAQLYTGISGIHAQMVDQYMMAENCTTAAAPDAVQVASIKPM